MKMLGEMLNNVREKCPLIHNITNYVTVNDCANVLLACGGSPIMADDIDEVREIVAICSGLNINIGTLNGNTINSMLAAGDVAGVLGKPILLDPVGVGASKLRTITAQRLLNNLKITAIRGNISEMLALFGENSSTSGVDASENDCKSPLEQTIALARKFSLQSGCVIAITGAVDVVSDSKKTYVIKNGNPMMSKVTGTGCMLSAVTAAYISANAKNPLDAAAAAVCAMGLCGEKAFARLTSHDGNATYRNYIIDEHFNLTAEDLEQGAKYEIIG